MGSSSSKLTSVKDYIIYQPMAKIVKPKRVTTLRTLVCIDRGYWDHQILENYRAEKVHVFFLFCGEPFIQEVVDWFKMKHNGEHVLYCFSDIKKPILAYGCNFSMLYGSHLQRNPTFKGVDHTKYFTKYDLLSKLAFLEVGDAVTDTALCSRISSVETPAVVDPSQVLRVYGDVVVIFNHGIRYMTEETWCQCKRLFFVGITQDDLTLPSCAILLHTVVFLHCNPTFVSHATDAINFKYQGCEPEIWIHAEKYRLPLFDGPVNKLLFNASAFEAQKQGYSIPVELQNFPVKNLKQDRDFIDLLEMYSVNAVIFSYLVNNGKKPLDRGSFCQLRTHTERKKPLKHVFLITPCASTADPVLMDMARDAWKNHHESPILPLTGSTDMSDAEKLEFRIKMSELIKFCALVVVYIDAKSTWTDDMEFYHAAALKCGKEVAYRDAANVAKQAVL